jgi:hypothetical protein
VILALVALFALSLVTIIYLDSNPNASSEGTTTITPPTVSSTTSAFVSNSSSGLRFNLQFQLGSNRTVVVKTDEYNTLNVQNNQTQVDHWKYPPDLLNPSNNCNSNLPTGFAILQGYYNTNNYTLGKALYLYNTTVLFSCTQNSYPFSYAFRPMSDTVITTLPHEVVSIAPASVSASVSGYWTGGEESTRAATFSKLPFGVYTVLGADEWGNILFLHFTIGNQ